MIDGRHWRALLAAVGVAAAAALVGCGGGDEDKREDDSDRDLDLIALVAAAFDEAPRRLPDGIELDDVTSEAGFTSQNVAVLSFWFTGTGGKEHHATAAIFRDEKQARAELTEAAESLEADESKDSRGHYCSWDLPLYLDANDASICLGRSGVVYLEVESGPAGESESEAALELLRSLEKYFDDLAEDATSRVRSLGPKALAAILASVPPPVPEGGKPLGFPETTDVEDEARSSGLVSKVNWPSEQSDRMAAFISVFDAASGAETYKSDYLGTLVAATQDESTCVTADSRAYRVCLRLVGETAILVQRQPERTTSPALDQPLLAWLAAVTTHVESIRNGRLPEAPPVTPTPVVTATVPAPATPTPTVGPQVKQVNAGTWTFDVIVESNTCPGDQLPVGNTFRTQYEFTDIGGDGFIASGETFAIYQLEPFDQDLGAVTAPLPSASFVHPASLGELTGFATVKLTFVSVNEANIEYIEDYGSCKLIAR